MLWHTDSIWGLRLHCSVACRILVPWIGIEPESPALQGGFLTTGPPGKFPEFLVKLGQHHFPNGVDPETSAVSPLTPVSVPWDTLWETLTLCKLLSQLPLWVIQKSERLNTWPSKKFNSFIVVLGTSLRPGANIMQERFPQTWVQVFYIFPIK